MATVDLVQALLDRGITKQQPVDQVDLEVEIEALESQLQALLDDPDISALANQPAPERLSGSDDGGEAFLTPLSRTLSRPQKTASWASTLTLRPTRTLPGSGSYGEVHVPASAQHSATNPLPEIRTGLERGPLKFSDKNRTPGQATWQGMPIEVPPGAYTQRGCPPGVRLYEDAKLKRKFAAERAAQMRRAQQEQQTAECSFSPTLVSRLPWPAPQAKSPLALPTGERLYAEAVDARRRQQLHLLELKKEEEEERRRNAPKSKPLSVAVYGSRPQTPRAAAATPSNKAFKDDSCTFKPSLNQRRPQSAPHTRPGMPALEPNVPLGSPFGTRARPATPPPNASLPRLTTTKSMQQRPGSPTWGPPPRKLKQSGRCAQSDAKGRVQGSGAWGDNGLPALVPQLGLAVELNFDEFLDRQLAFVRAKDAKVSEQRLSSSRRPSPLVSRGSQRLVSTPQDAKEVAEGVKASWELKRKGMQAAPSFQPVLTPKAQQRSRRLFSELSEGDRLRHEYHKEQMRMERLMEESRELTFSPATNSIPGAQASPQIRRPEICGGILHRRQQQHLEHVRNEALLKEVEELAECTFAPKIIKRVPSYLTQIKTQQKLKDKVGLEFEEASGLPQME